MINRIGVFCSASDTIDKTYFEQARKFGEWIGNHKKTLIYGGTNLGLMEETARAAKAKGAHIIGVIPNKIEENGWQSQYMDQAIHTKTLSDRKDVMMEESDILVALPGGIGTFDEIFHVMAGATIAYHQKKIIFFNLNGFYTKLLEVMDDLYKGNFIRGSLSDYYYVADNLDKLTELLS